MIRKTAWGTMARYLVLLFFAAVWCVPLYIAVVTPFKSIRDIFTDPVGLPASWGLENFQKVFQQVDIFHYLKNSFFITGLSVILLSMLAALAAYALLRSNLRALKSAYPLFAFGIMVPTQACMIALFNTIRGLGLYNTLPGMVLAYLGCCIPVSVFLYYGFFKSIPYEIIESAYLDGCGEFAIFSRIVVPLSTSATGTVIIYNCVNIWKDFTYPLIFTQGEKVKTLTIAVYSMKGQYISDYSALFAGILIATLPLLLVYIALQRQFIQGITAGAVKG